MTTFTLGKNIITKGIKQKSKIKNINATEGKKEKKESQLLLLYFPKQTWSLEQ